MLLYEGRITRVQVRLALFYGIIRHLATQNVIRLGLQRGFIYPPVHLCSEAMPVAVDTTPAMAASIPKKAAPPPSHDVPPPDPPKSTKRPRKKAVEQTAAQAEPVPGPSKSSHSKPPWSWRSLTVSASSKVPLLFTKDNRYAAHPIILST